MHKTLALAALGLLIAAPAVAQTAKPLPDPIQLNFIGTDGQPTGTGLLSPGPTGVLIRLELKGVSPGWHGIHLHAVGQCTPPDFKSAGAHINAGGHQHGLKNAMGAEEGDLPNIYAGPDGTVMAELFTTKVSLAGEGGRPALRDADGSSVVIHAASDDQTSTPIGESGARIACAVIAPAAR